MPWLVVWLSSSQSCHSHIADSTAWASAERTTGLASRWVGVVGGGLALGGGIAGAFDDEAAVGLGGVEGQQVLGDGGQQRLIHGELQAVSSLQGQTSDNPLDSTARSKAMKSTWFGVFCLFVILNGVGCV